MKKKKLLITGGSGLLGSNVAYCLKDRYDISGVYHSNRIRMEGVEFVRCNLCKKEEVAKLVNDVKPDIIFHGAAESNVESCEENPKLAHKLNVVSTKYLVDSAFEKGIKFIYISSDLVYDGQKGCYSERDVLGPLNIYAKTKVEAEKEVSSYEQTVIFRTNFFGWNIQDKNSLAEWVIDNLKNDKRIKGFSDSIFSSIYTFDFAEILDKAIITNIKGIYNLGCKTSLSKYRFAVFLCKKFGFDEDLIESISIDDYKFKAKRSKNLSLNISKLSRDVNVLVPTIEESIEHFVKDFKLQMGSKFKSFRA